MSTTPPKSFSSSSSSSPSDTTNSSEIIIKIPSSSETDASRGETTLTLSVTNVVCSFATKCHLNLRKIAMEGMHVEFKKENNMVSMKLRKPATTASIWSTGKCTCTGAQSESDAYTAARRFCRLLQKMKFRIKLSNYRVVNVLATVILPFQLDIIRLAEAYPTECSYEPELHPGATFKVCELRATLKLFSTGSITLTAPSVNSAKRAIEHIFPILERYKFNDIIRNTQKQVQQHQQHKVEANQCNPHHQVIKLVTTTQATTSSPNILRIENLEVVAATTTAPVTDSTSSSSSTSSYSSSTSSSSSSSSLSTYADHYHHNHHHNHHSNHHLYHHFDPWSHHHLHDVVPLPTSVTSGTNPAVTQLQPSQAQSSHHWFGDNLLIDNVLDDFLQ